MGDNSDVKKLIWGVAFGSVALIATTGGTYATVMYNKVNDIEKTNSIKGERIVVLESHYADIQRRLTSIDTKLDKLAERRYDTR